MPLIQGTFSTNCMAAVEVSNWPYSGSVTRKLTSAPIRATQRTVRAWSSRPSASRMAPNTIGVQMASERSPTFILVLPSLLQPVADHGPADEVRHEHHHAQQHREGVVIDVAGLHPADHAGEPAHRARAAVDEHAFDDALVAALPQPGAERAGRAGD